MKIGVVGSGMIVKDCLAAMEALEDIECVAICVREKSIQKGKELCQKYKIPTLYTKYEELLKNKEIDFVYLGIVNSEHYSYAKRALEEGQNVIVEKPFTATAGEAQELIQIAKEKQLFLFEAITLLYFPNFCYVKEHLSDLGKVKLVQCNFSQYSSRYDRYLQGDVAPAFDPACCGGALYDLNLYNIYFITALFGAPKKVSYVANIGYNGIDTSGILTMEYDELIAVCMAAKDSSSPNYACIQGTNGYLKVNSQVSICESIEQNIGGIINKINNNRYPQRMQHEFAGMKEVFVNRNFKECYEKLNCMLEVMKILEACNIFS